METRKMPGIWKHFWFFLFLALCLNAKHILGQKNINAFWPYKDSIPFPYPTPGPINIIIKKTKPVLTPVPLTFIAKSFSQKKTLINTGTTLVTEADEDSPSEFITGGVLYNDTYIFFQNEFFWAKSPKGKAAVLINGAGTPIQAVSSFYNSKYDTLQNARTKRDGIAQVVYPIIVGSVPNYLFYPFQFAVQNVLKAGSTLKISNIISYIWFFLPSTTKNYFAYPGQYVDHETGKTYDSSTVIVPIRTPIPFISFNQFYATFDSLKNKAGKSYSHSLETVPTGSRPVVSANGISFVPLVKN